MNILIIGSSKIKYMPYLNMYLENIDLNLNNIHIITWSYDGIREETPLDKRIIHHEFFYHQENEISFTRKIKGFFKFKLFVSKILRKNSFDFIITLLSGNGVLFSRELSKYKNRFILDYRDYTYEKYFLFRWLLFKTVKNSKYTFISSEGFRKVFPRKFNNKILNSHNINSELINYKFDDYLFFEQGKVIKIVFWGLVRYLDLSKALLMNFKDDERFEFHFYGAFQKNTLALLNYVEENDIKNVFFHGEYSPNDRYFFRKTANILNNVYEGTNANLAISNKYYDGVFFGIPQICFCNSFTAINVEKKGLGIGIDPYEKNCNNVLYDYYKNLDFNLFLENCKIERKKISDEYFNLCKLIQTLFNNGGDDL